MPFDINLPYSVAAYALRCAGMVVDTYSQHTMDVVIGNARTPFELQLPYFLSETPLNISVTVLEVTDAVRLRVAAPDLRIEEYIRECLERYSVENDGSSVVDREVKDLHSRIEAILNREGLSFETLHQGGLLNRRAIESLAELADDVDRCARGSITFVFVNGRVERESREFALRWLIKMFMENPDPFERAQISLRINENMVASAADDVIRLIQDCRYGESRVGLLTALARTKHPLAADTIASVLHDKHLALPGLEALAKLKATQHVEKVRPFLRHSDSAVRREAGKTLKRLGFPVSLPPKPVHLVRNAQIPGNLSEWSLGLDMDDVPTTLKDLSSCLDSGFGAAEIAEVIGVIEEMRPDQTRVFRFSTVADGEPNDLWLAVFLDDVDSPDLAVHTSPDVVEKFRSIVTVE